MFLPRDRQQLEIGKALIFMSTGRHKTLMQARSREKTLALPLQAARVFHA
jgi:hypothetical protein